MRGFAASEQQLKARMKTTGSIKKITAAMKMISTTKMKGDRDRLENGKQFGMNALDMIFKSDQFLQRKMPGEVGECSTVIVPISSDKGFCGAINSSIVRDVKRTVGAGNRSNYQIFSVGDKGTTGLQRPFPDLLKSAITHVAAPINYPSIMAMAGQVANMAEDADKILIIHNFFVSAIAYEQRHVELMTRSKFLDVMQYGKLYDMKLPDKNTSNTALYELYLTANLYVAFLQNVAAAQSARMQAMDNASKNAGEMLDSLTLEYNKARQARITTELCEIIGGVTAL